MHILMILMIGILLVFIFLMILKIIRSTSIYDKMNGLSVIGAHVIILLVILGFLDGRPEMYIDIAIAYGFLGFVTNIVVAKYLGRKKHAKEEGKS